MSRPLRLLAASVDFGFGSSGKLSSILEVLDDCDVVLAGSTHSRHVIREDRIEAYYPTVESPARLREIVARHELDGALVVLNPDFAKLCHEAEVPTVFVDSLPFLWTDHDLVFHEAVSYCAQNFPFLPELCWDQLRRIEHLDWVEGIVPPTADGRASRRDPRTAVVNFGGIGTHLLSVDESAYPSIVAPAVLDALHAAGYERVTLTGNLGSARLPEELTQRDDMEVRFAPSSHDRFQELMRSAAVLLTSPGLTTIIESGATGTPTILLPPQNVSQFLNAEGVVHAGATTGVVSWPESVVRRDAMERVRRQGEDPALEVVYAAIASAEGDPVVRAELRDRTLEALGDLGALDGTQAYVDTVGVGGAQQVADRVRAALG